MALPKIKSTYSLDVDTVRKLERMASRLGITKSEALRRAIRAAAESTSEQRPAVAALEELQRSLGLTHDASSDWAKRVTDERRRAALRRQPRHRQPFGLPKTRVGRAEAGCRLTLCATSN